MARRTAATCVTAPVEVSLWTTHTALNREGLVLARARASMAATSAPARQSEGMKVASTPSLAAMVFHSVAKWPVSTISTLSPGDSVLASAASQAPVPDAG
jgi:hypothetical protein